MAAVAGYCQGDEKAQQCLGTQKKGCLPLSGGDSQCGTITVISHFASELREFWDSWLYLCHRRGLEGVRVCPLLDIEPSLSLN